MLLRLAGFLAQPTREQIFRVSGDRRIARLFRGWSRLKLHAVSLSAAEGALPAATTTTTAIGIEAMEGEATSATDSAVENMNGDFTHQLAKAAMMVSYVAPKFFLV